MFTSSPLFLEIFIFWPVAMVPNRSKAIVLCMLGTRLSNLQYDQSDKDICYVIGKEELIHSKIRGRYWENGVECLDPISLLFFSVFKIIIDL